MLIKQDNNRSYKCTNYMSLHKGNMKIEGERSKIAVKKKRRDSSRLIKVGYASRTASFSLVIVTSA